MFRGSVTRERAVERDNWLASLVPVGHGPVGEVSTAERILEAPPSFRFPPTSSPTKAVERLKFGVFLAGHFLKKSPSKQIKFYPYHFCTRSKTSSGSTLIKCRFSYFFELLKYPRGLIPTSSELQLFG